MITSKIKALQSENAALRKRVEELESHIGQCIECGIWTCGYCGLHNSKGEWRCNKCHHGVGGTVTERRLAILRETLERIVLKCTTDTSACCGENVDHFCESFGCGYVNQLANIASEGLEKEKEVK